ncbi:GM11524 [Drosophila sechellia]|uniref:GM11524 n=1 Tax=Drosophila sechellia TaxID=7238 RepID=B4IGK5_DROSE|nr:GM11524 [Drosophila sechellia]
MLREEDIMEDWTIIRKALMRSSSSATAAGTVTPTSGVSVSLSGLPAMAGASG